MFKKWVAFFVRLLSGTSWQGVTKGYTNHEHLIDQELIHMNGRIYDFNVGRFLSVDPFLQFPENSQSANPYSYILNNPMSGVDPTGYRSVRSGNASAWATNELMGDMYSFHKTVEEMQYNKAMKALKKSTSNGEKNEEKSTDNGSKSHEDEGNDGSSLNAGVEASGEGKSSAHLEFAGKNIYLSANGKIMVYINKDDVHIFELDLVIDEGKSHSSASDMNDSWNTEVMTDQDGNRYQGIANIRGATFNQKISGDIDIVVNACTNCNTVPLAPGAKANGPLGEATVSGSDMWLPTSRVLYRNDVAGHELGHNLGLRNCSSCNSIMTNSSRYKDVKATLQDIKTLYNGYR